MKPQAETTSPNAGTSTPKSRGLKQSWRALWLGVAFLLFAATTYWAFFDPQFESESWWLHPIEFNTSSRLNRIEPDVDFTCISALPGGREIWVGGTKGMILHTKDGGNSWEQLPMTAAEETPPASTANPSPRPSPTPQSKASQSDPLNTRMRSVVSLEENEWMRVTLAEDPRKQAKSVLQSQTTPYAAPPSPTPDPVSTRPRYRPPTREELEEPPASWPEQGDLFSTDINDLQFVSSTVGFVLTNGRLLTSRDAGRTWRVLPEAVVKQGTARLKFSDEKRGLISGFFGIARTTDGGETWSAPNTWTAGHVVYFTLTDGLNGLAVTGEQVLEFTQTKTGVEMVSEIAPVPEDQNFIRITKVSEGPVFLCGADGAAARIVNGREWQELATGVAADLRGIFFASGRIGWAVGNGGTIIATKDGGDHWEKQSSGTDNNLAAAYFSSPIVGFIAGQNGTLLRTNDGGQNWFPLVVEGSAKSSSSHGWIPAPFYLFSLLLFFGLIKMIPPEITKPSPGIGQLLVSDKPIGPNDPDYLGFQHVALGLSSYLRNNATNPPLTIAITGEWGMGKSSLMNLLDADLRSYKFRPVWFNAWHHQTEEHLLAALLENVRTQAIPSMFSPEGIVFRVKLLWLRARRHPLAFLLVIAAVSFCVSYFAQDANRLWQSPKRLQDFLREPGKKIIDAINPNSEGGKALLVIISAVGSLITFLKAFRAFGVDPASLLASQSKAAKPGDLRAQTSFRYNFANEFREVTNSLNPLTMVLFVDDLDRCRPEQAYDMLEAVNFLVTCGDCFVVMGLARRRVERCVGLVFDKVAAEGADHEDGKHLSRLQQRQRFAKAYLDKLINLEVRVPKGDLAQNLSLLVRKAAANPPRNKIAVVGEKVSSAQSHLVPLALALFAVMFAVWASGKIFDSSTPPPTVASSEFSPTPTPSDQPKTAPDAATFDSPTSTPMPPPETRTAPANFWPGRTGSPPLWVMLLLAAAILIAGLIRLARRTGTVIEDSPGFIQALEKWFPFLSKGNDMTPREVKRFVNRLRYFAMMKGSFRPAARWWKRLADFFEAKSQPLTSPPPDSREDLLVALATIHERYPGWFSSDLPTFVKIFQSERTKKTHGPPTFNPSDVTSEIYADFKALVTGVEIH